MARSTEAVRSCELAENWNSCAVRTASPRSLNGAQPAGLIVILETLLAGVMREPLARNE